MIRIGGRPSAGLDFGTTNTVAAIGGEAGRQPHLVAFEGPNGADAVLRLALCF